ncbi:hypothetical protein PABG_03376 [Paracoccidioides brasiliensis Pb03]|nr:hypothetical protein PABG_03376 [Paracoccidioides brasiliensis Pb03]
MAYPSSLSGALKANGIFSWLRRQLSWKNLALLLAVLNLKSLPLVWHARVFFHLFKRINFHRHSHPKLVEIFHKKKGHVGHHPLFTPVTIVTHTPLLEMDYNMHKSNSTYFSDLDIARTALVTNLVTPGMELCRRELEKEVDSNGKKKYPGRLAVMLGSVYCSFKKEIAPYERYDMQSRLSGWDDKWLYVITYFLRPTKRTGEKKTILAIGVSQYVIKKGRLTVKPAKVFQAGGLMPVRLDGADSSNGTPSGSGIPLTTDTPANGEAINSGEGLDESLVREVMTLTDSTDLSQAVLENKRRDNENTWVQEWTWERIEEQRLKGLDFVKAFIGLDAKLLQGAEL